MPIDESMRCTGTKKSGEPCGSPKTATSAFCPHHDPAVDAETKREWSRRGALALARRSAKADLKAAVAVSGDALAILGGRPDLSDPKGITALLEATACALVSRQLPPSSAAVLVKLADVANRAVDTRIASELAAVVDEQKRARKVEGAWK